MESESNESDSKDVIDSDTSDSLEEHNGSHAQLIDRYLRQNDSKRLKELALTNGGFVSDALRRCVWPKVLSVSVVESSPRPDARSVESHPFYNQVLLDVNRSLKRFPPSIQESQRISMQDSLVRLIMRVLMKNPRLFYYQGYHDICVTFLLVMGEESAFYIVNKLSNTHLRVFMEETMEGTGDLLDIIPIIVRHENSDLSQHIDKSSVGTIFSLSWVITWFSHVLKRYDDVVRLFDLFLVSHELMPVYFTVAIILSKQTEILKTDCDMASMHHYLANIPEREELAIESLISTALSLMDKYEPEKMIAIQKEEKKLRIQMENKRLGVFRKYFRIFHVIKWVSRLNFVSITVVMVFIAFIYQYYRNY